MQNHKNKTRRDSGRREPAERVSRVSLFGIQRLTVREYFSENKSAGNSAQVRPIVRPKPLKQESNREKRHDPRDQPRTHLLHLNAGAASGHRDKYAGHSQNRAARAYRWMAAQSCAQQRSAESRYGVEEKVARRSVCLLDERPDIHQDQHIHADVQQAAVQVLGGEKAVQRVVGVTKRNAHSEAIECFSVHTPQNVQTAGILTELHSDEPCDPEHDEIQDEQKRRNGRVSAKYSGETLADCGEREAQICPALMATSCCDAHEGTAGGAEFGAGLFVSAAEGAAQDALQFL